MPFVEGNPFGLVYDGAIEENVAGQVNIRPVSYHNPQGIEIVRAHAVSALRACVRRMLPSRDRRLRAIWLDAYL